MKTIYYITDNVLDSTLVSTVHIDEVCKNMGAQGNKVVLYAPALMRLGSKPPYEIKYISTPRWMLSVFFQIHLFFKLLIDITRSRPSFIYSRHNLLLFVPVWVGKIFDVPVFLEVNGELLRESNQVNHTLLGKLLSNAGFLKFIESMNVKLATGMITVTSGIKDYLVKQYSVDSNKICAIQNGVNGDFFTPGSLKNARKKVGISQETAYVGYIGSLYPWQGIKYILEAANIVCKKRTDVNFIIVGNGSELNFVKTFIENSGLAERIILKGAVPHSLVPTHINALDICLSYPDTTRSGNTSPFKIYEYLACGKRVVSSDISGMKKEFGQIIFYAKPESPKSLASSVVQLLDDKKARLEAEIKARKFIEDGHTWSKVTEKILNYCEK